MGRSVTPPFRIEFNTVGGRITPFGWWVRRAPPFKSNGKPTFENLKTEVDGVIASGKPGGVNARSMAGLVVLGAKLVRNDGSGEVVATYEIPMFEMVA